MTKYLVPVIGMAFLILLGYSLYISKAHYEGLVEEGYSEKAEHYFKNLKKEDALGLQIKVSETLEPFDVWINTKEGPLRGAAVVLRVGRIDSSRDLRFPLKEVSPGHYRASVELPRGGYYMFNLEISSSEIKTTRRWFKRVWGEDRGERGNFKKPDL